MRFVLASWGSRGDIEPCVAVGRELLQRGHDVCMAVPPELVGLAESVGLSAVAYGPDAQTILEAHRQFWTRLFRTPWKLRELKAARRNVREPVVQRWQEITTTLTSLAEGADLVFSGLNFEDAALNVAEYYDIPLATLHYFPLRPNGQLLSFLPPPLSRALLTVFEWLTWRVTKKLEDVQRRELGLPKTTSPAPRRIAERGSLEIQAYDEVCFPGLAAEWAGFNGQRPFVGALTLQLPTDADEEVGAWIGEGTPPVFFGFGSIAVDSAADTLTMISTACAELGRRALVCAAGTDYRHAPRFEHVKVVDTMNFAAAFPSCAALVHHGGAGTTAAGLRAGVPQLILSTDLDQSLWGTRVKRLQVGTARRFSTTTEQSLVADLRTILTPDYAARARQIASQMTPPAQSVATAANLLEDFARRRRVS
ncbi:glycosyltransferase [Mycobacterium noviomagense]|uniref:Glycosyl transferase family 1 n=1 Tax=Mycobacterium noviomagense TaxID=459858 RepID=A0ABX3SYW2_9MYCO|nr:glycosyltransferase [Mycobacterium noviomagense]ORB10760.1 glycosyl transferase family 1 [Mycobacterium noviomagense]